MKFGRRKNPVQHQVNDLLAHSVVPPRVVVRGVLLSRNQLLGMEQLPVCASPSDLCYQVFLFRHSKKKYVMVIQIHKYFAFF